MRPENVFRECTLAVRRRMRYNTCTMKLRFAFQFQAGAAAAWLAAAVCAAAPALRAQEAEGAEDPALEEDVKFASALNNNSLPDFAATVIAEGRKKWPKEEAQWSRLEVEALANQGKFDKVKPVIEAAKSRGPSVYWAMNLSLAAAYYSYGRREECVKIYKQFFDAMKGNPPADIRKFYVNAAFTYAYLIKDRPKEVLEIYKPLYGLLKGLSSGSGKDKYGSEFETVASAYAELLLKTAEENPPDSKIRKACLDSAKPVISELLWHTESLVFGQAIAMRAHIALLAADSKGGAGVKQAQKIIEEYLPQLRTMHDRLKAEDPANETGALRFSALPQCRFLLAKTLWTGVQAELKKPKPDEERIKSCIFGERKADGKRSGTGAFNHALNVFLKYPESTWASDADELCTTIQKFVKDRYKAEIKYNATPEQRARVRQMQFQEADKFFEANDFAKAIPAYESVLSRFPEYPESIAAWGRLAIANLEEGGAISRRNDPERVYRLLCAETIALQLAERYCPRMRGKAGARAGDDALRVAGKLDELEEGAAAAEIYYAYLRNCRSHSAYSQMATALGFKAYADAEKAADEAVKRGSAEEPEAEHAKESRRLYGLAVKYLSCVPKTAVTAGDAMLRKAQAQIKLDDDAGAKATLAAMIEAFKDAPAARVNALLQLASLQKQEGVAMLQATEETAEKLRAASGPAEIPAIIGKADTNDVSAVVASCAGQPASALVEALHKRGSYWLVKAVQDFTKLAVDVKAALADRRTSPDDRRAMTLSHEFAMFQVGDSWQRLTHPPERIEQFRARAADAYAKYVEEYPKGTNAPMAYFRMGTLYSTLTNDASSVAKAGKALADLQTLFPDSDLAKNSIPRLAETYLEMNMPAEAAVQYKKMLDSDGKYNERDFLKAGDALVAKSRFELAQEAYTKAMKLAEKGEYAGWYVPKCRFGLAKAYAGARNWVEANETINEFVEKEEEKKAEARRAGKPVSESPLVKDALRLLADLGVKAGRAEQNDKVRQERFNNAAGALKKLMQRYPLENMDKLTEYRALAASGDPKDKAVEDAKARIARYSRNKTMRDSIVLEIAKILVQKMKAETEMGRTEEARKSLKNVAISYATFINENMPDGILTPLEEQQGMTKEAKISRQIAEKREGGEMENLERGIAEAMQYLIAEGGAHNLETAVRSGEFYMENFPEGRDFAAVKGYVERAKALQGADAQKEKPADAASGENAPAKAEDAGNPENAEKPGPAAPEAPAAA